MTMAVVTGMVVAGMYTYVLCVNKVDNIIAIIIIIIIININATTISGL